MAQNILHTLKRYQTIRSHRISVLPIAILMPHSACNCRCVMCDIWKGNKNAKQLNEDDVRQILHSLKKLNTRRVLMSGGEALLNKNFFRFCELIRAQKIKVTLLSTGLTLQRHAENIVRLVDDVIVSLDGDKALHDEIRNINGAFAELKQGVQAIKSLQPAYRITARSVIHRHNYKSWHRIILAAKDLGVDQVSFLPADVTSEAFNREQAWDKEKQQSVLIPAGELPAFKQMVDRLITDFKILFDSKYIAESPSKIKKIYQYYCAHHGLAGFPLKKCNAPWVSAVVEADGTVRPCFFHDAIGSIKNTSLEEILNSPASLAYRKNLNVQTNPTCVKCVCSLNLAPRDSKF